MLFPIKRLIDGQGKPLCITKKSLVREALTLMVENDYSQLPVVDENGLLVGLISENSIVKSYYQIGTAISLLDITIDHCMSEVKELSPDADIFEALNLLDDFYAIVVVNNKEPVGILTNYDTTKFFQDLTEGLIIIEDIEVTLRQYIEKVFSNKERMNAALFRAFKENKKNPTLPAREYNELNFSEHIQLIITENNWEKFSFYLGPKEIFNTYMEKVGIIRNQLAHFRGKLEPIQLSTLVQVKHWLATRSKPELILPEIVGNADILLDDMVVEAHGEVKSNTLKHYLNNLSSLGKTSLQLDFSQFEELLGYELPKSARIHQSWWSNSLTTNPQAEDWVLSGWFIYNVDMETGKVFFKRSQQDFVSAFLNGMLARVKKIRPGILSNQSAYMDYRLIVFSGISGFNYGWALPPNESKMMVELHIDKGNTKENFAALEALKEIKNEIESKIGAELVWDSRDKDLPCRVFTSKQFDSIYHSKEYEKVKLWGVEMMLKFIDEFQPRLSRI